MAEPRWRLSDINAMDHGAFVALFGFLFEGSPWIVSDAWRLRPWTSVDAFHATLLGIVAGAGKRRQLELIRAHPDLVGRAALAGTLSRESTAEQRAAGLDPGALNATDIARFQSANAAYGAKFGFPFVICAREHGKEDILLALETRLANEPSQEIEIALHEIGRIAWHRLNTVVPTETAPGMTMMDDRYRLTVSYGKQGVAVYRVFATPLGGVRPIPESPFASRQNNLLACEIDVEVFGDEFLPAYTHGDNSMVVATDSMKNFIIRESLAFAGSTMEALLHFLASGFASTYPQLHTLTLSGREIPFTAAVIPDAAGAFQPGENLFHADGGARAFASVAVAELDGTVTITDHECGITGIRLMKLTGSAFTSFVRDDYTTLPERGDRPLFIYMDVSWRYADPMDMIDPARGQYVPKEQMGDLLAATFDAFVSESIQHLIHEMGTRALERFPQFEAISFDAQNRTRDPSGQREDDATVRVYSDPFPAYGRLTLTMARER